MLKFHFTQAIITMINVDTIVFYEMIVITYMNLVGCSKEVLNLAVLVHMMITLNSLCCFCLRACI